MKGILRTAVSTWILAALSTLALTQSPGLRLHLRYGVFDPTLGVPVVPERLLAGTDTHLLIVQFDRAFTDGDRATLRAAGARLHAPLPHRALVVDATSASAPALRRLDGVRWVGPYQPAYRLEPELLTEIATGQRLPVRRYNMVMADKRRDKNLLARKIAAIGGVVTHRHPGSLSFTAELSGDQLIATARFDQVLWIDRWTPEQTDMNNARIVQGSNHVEMLAGYTGTGIRGHSYEGLEAGHVDWNVTPTNVRSGGAATDHGHAVAGCIWGNGTSSINARGHAPDAIAFYTNYSTVTSGFSRNQVIGEVVNIHNCLFTTASWGNATTTQYTSLSADADDIVFDHRIAWTQSQSNTGNQNSRPQAWGKNVISIGGVQHNNNANPADDNWGGSGSIGPAADGRIKPDLCNFYDDVWTSDRTGTAGYSNGNSTQTFGGTSAATPITAGTNAIAIQMFLAGEFNHTPRVAGGNWFQNRPYAQTVKALQIACATPYLFSQGNRYQLGWGYPRLDKMYDRRHVISIVPEDTPITQGGLHSYPIDVPAGMDELKVCMSFVEPAGNPAAAVAAVNDLSLEVIDPNGLRYWGNRGLTQSNASTTGGAANTGDSVECVFVVAPTPGQWTIEITAPTIAQDAHLATAATDATYALVCNGAANMNGALCARYAPNAFPTGSVENEPFGGPAAATLPTVLGADTHTPAGGTAYFDLLALNDVWITGLDLNTNTAIGTGIIVDVYAAFGTFVGNTASPGIWAPQTAGHGVAATLDTPSRVTFNAPIRLGALQPIGVAVVARNFTHSTTTGNGANQAHGDANLAFTAGAVTTGRFAGALSSPQVPNFTLQYRTDSGGTVNQVWQAIVRQGQIGNVPTNITDLGFVPADSGVHYNETLQIRMALVTPGHTLSSSFAANLPAPTLVLDVADHSWPLTADAWNEIGLQRPLAYDGLSDVVIEVRTTGNHHTGTGGFRRGNVAIPRVWASGFGHGLAPASGTIDDAGLRMRLSLNCAAAGEYGTSCGPLRAGHTNAPIHGTTFTFGLDNAEPNSGAILAAGFHNSPPLYPQSLNVFGNLGLTNCYQWHDALTTVFKLTDPAGMATHDFPLPNTTGFDGVLIYGQWFQIQANGDATASNYTRVLIGADTP